MIYIWKCQLWNESFTYSTLRYGLRKWRNVATMLCYREIISLQFDTVHGEFTELHENLNDKLQQILSDPLWKLG